MHKKVILILLIGFGAVGLGFWKPLFLAGQHLIYGIDNLFYQSESQIETVTFSSESDYNRLKEIKVYLPKGYQPHGSQSYPSIYFLHGDPGSNSDWILNADIQQTLDTLIAQQQLPPLIAIFPDGRGEVVDNSQYLDATRVDQKIASFISQDLVSYITSRYSVADTPERRAIIGASTGGYGAVNIALHHPDIFGYALSLSGYFQPLEENQDLLINQADIAVNSPLIYISTVIQTDIKIPRLYLYVGTSDDAYFVDQNQQFNEVLTQLEIPHVYDFDDGGHGWQEWKTAILPALEQLHLYGFE